MGAKKGILFKTAVSLEETGKMDIVVLDKTGTITTGEPKVTDILPAEGVSENELITMAYALEKKSEHPLARAILQKAEESHISADEVSEFTALPGNGLTATLNGSKLTGGNFKFISSMTSLGPYSLCQPYYIAGRDYYAMLLCTRNSSNTAQHLLAYGKCAINFIPDKGKYFKEAVRLGFPGDTPAEKMKDCLFTLEDGQMAAEHPDEQFPQVVAEAYQVMGGRMQLCTFVCTPNLGTDLPVLLIDAMRFGQKRAAFVEYYDCTAHGAVCGPMQAVFGTYRDLPDYTEKPAWYIASRAPYSLIKGGADGARLEAMMSWPSAQMSPPTQKALNRSAPSGDGLARPATYFLYSFFVISIIKTPFGVLFAKRGFFMKERIRRVR